MAEELLAQVPPDWKGPAPRALCRRPFKMPPLSFPKVPQGSANGRSFDEYRNRLPWISHGWIGAPSWYRIVIGTLWGKWEMFSARLLPPLDRTISGGADRLNSIMWEPLSWHVQMLL